MIYKPIYPPVLYSCSMYISLRNWFRFKYTTNDLQKLPPSSRFNVFVYIQISTLACLGPRRFDGVLCYFDSTIENPVVWAVLQFFGFHSSKVLLSLPSTHLAPNLTAPELYTFADPLFVLRLFLSMLSFRFGCAKSFFTDSTKYLFFSPLLSLNLPLRIFAALMFEAIFARD